MQVDGFFYLHQFASEKKLLLLLLSSSSSQQKRSRCERQRDGELGRVGEGGAEWEEGCCWVRDARQDECFDKDGESAPEV
jgi:hypothetical protein